MSLSRQKKAATDRAHSMGISPSCYAAGPRISGSSAAISFTTAMRVSAWPLRDVPSAAMALSAWGASSSIVLALFPMVHLLPRIPGEVSFAILGGTLESPFLHPCNQGSWFHSQKFRSAALNPTLRIEGERIAGRYPFHPAAGGAVSLSLD